MEQELSPYQELAIEAVESLGGIQAVKVSPNADHVIGAVFVAIEGDTAMMRKYRLLVTDDNGMLDKKKRQVTNRSISQATAKLMDGKTFGQKEENPQSSLVQSYSLLQL